MMTNRVMGLDIKGAYAPFFLLQKSRVILTKCVYIKSNVYIIDAINNETRGLEKCSQYHF